MSKPKRTPPNNVNFSDRDDFLMARDMANGQEEALRFLLTFDNGADGNNLLERETEQEQRGM